MFRNDSPKDTQAISPAPSPGDPVANPGIPDAAPPETAPHRPVRRIVEQIDALSGAERVSLDRIIQTFGRTSFLPMMLVPALLLVSPLSGIPLFSTFCGLCIFLIAVQRVAQRDRLWLPRWLTRRDISGAALHKGAVAVRRTADWLDRHSRPRFGVLVTPPFNVVCFLLCALAGLTIPFLELVPFSSSILGLMVTLIVVGLLVRDGIYVIAAIALGTLAASVPFLLVAKVVE